MTKRNNRKDAERWNQDRDSIQLDAMVNIKSKKYGFSKMHPFSGRIKYYEERDIWLGKYVFGNDF